VTTTSTQISSTKLSENVFLNCGDRWLAVSGGVGPLVVAHWNISQLILHLLLASVEVGGVACTLRS
jgi:hypothetical protein